MVFASVFLWQRNIVDGLLTFRRAPGRPMPRLRPVAFNISDFGAVGDGGTDNTAAFERAISTIAKFGKRGGAQLNVPPGVWLTCPFNLTSHMTLYLAEDAVILGVDVSLNFIMSVIYKVVMLIGSKFLGLSDVFDILGVIYGGYDMF